MVAWLTMVGSVIVVLLVFDRVSGLHTLETRQSIEKFLAEPPGSDLGLGVDGVLSMIRTLAMVTAGCATAAAILGYQVLRRSRSARLALTVLAVPLFFAGLVTGGFVSSLVAASAAMLWLQPARDWFGDTPRTAPAAPAAPAPPATLVAAAPSAPVAATSSARPTGVTVACVLTWMATGLTTLGLVATGVLLALRPETLLDEVHRQNPELRSEGVSDDLLIGVTFALIAAMVLWCVSAAVLAVLVFRRTEWARIVLVVSAGTAAALSLVGTAIGAFLLALTLVASVATLALLLRPDVRQWFSQRPGQRPPAVPGPPR
ncbi:hypothetical protein GCM10009606_04400 [Nocardioides aquiterrae]|uniref:Uncharacterized protein n=2 Tax=Nocardioides aquiterrae TaxID=203799 RepID=A0ABP4ERP3_9ACTN